MPSFFEAVKRMVQGKPVFDAPEQPRYDTNPLQPPAAQPPPPTTAQPQAPQTSIRKGVSGTFPVVYVKHTSTKLNGSTMQVYCWIVNSFNEQVFVDKINILGTTRELDCDLRAGESREFHVYSGPAPTNPQREAKLQYKTHLTNDYFEAVHDVTFDFHSNNKTYVVDELKLHPPIRDIFG